MNVPELGEIYIDNATNTKICITYVSPDPRHGVVVYAESIDGHEFHTDIYTFNTTFRRQDDKILCGDNTIS